MLKRIVNILQNIGSFIKENFKIMIPLLLILVIFISFFIYYKISLMDTYRKYEDVKVYQYFYGQKYEYTAHIGFNRKDEVVELTTKDYDITYDSTPVYYEDDYKVIFPNNMSIVMPTLNCSEYFSPAYTMVSKKKNSYYLKTTRFDNKIGHYFLYDGLNLYFFLDEVKLTVNGKEVKLSPFSYVTTSSVNQNITYYDKKSDTITVVPVKDYKTVVENDYYKVNVSVDQIDYFGQNVVLTSQVSSLNSIDRKGK